MLSLGHQTSYNVYGILDEMKNEQEIPHTCNYNRVCRRNPQSDECHSFVNRESKKRHLCEIVILQIVYCAKISRSVR